MGLEPKLSKKSYFNSISKITRFDHPLLNFAKCQTCSASCRVFEWTVVVRKRSQDNIRLHFTSKTPYSSDTRGILSTPACDVHGRLKRTTSNAIRKIRSISWQTVNGTFKRTKFLLFTKTCIESEVSLIILSHE